jgi:hypothetical protein
MSALLQTLGLGMAGSLAGAAYWLFSWLDCHASLEANNAISQWIKGEAYRRIDLGDAVVHAFDRLYTAPLFTAKAFGRSATISTICFILPALLVVAWGVHHITEARGWVLTAVELGLSLPIVILSDYASIFVVRRCLALSQRHLLGALILAFAAGVAIVFAVFLVVGGATMLFINQYAAMATSDAFTQIIIVLGLMGLIQAGALSIVSASFVHLWLPLMVLGLLALRLSYVVFKAASWMQWFLVKGDSHPLRAIGLVATVAVFAVAAVVTGLAAVI